MSQVSLGPMKIKLTVFMLSLFATSAISQGGAGTVADLPSGLRQALLRDSSCEKAENDGAVADQAQLLESPIVTQTVRGAGGGEVGVIAVLRGGCHCRDANCGTYVYLKSGEDYKLAFSRVFTSLHPMRGFRRGFPSLTGKLQLSESKAETTVYDWNGSEYQPSLCATVTQAKGQKRPIIVRHECAKAP